MKRTVVGILAHVDAGKTTLSEAILYRCGIIKKQGRVDHQDAFLDNNAMERERGITIFSKQAVLPLSDDLEVILLDTPGHVDFSTEMERTLQVLDYAILVISGTDGVQSHTQTLWKLLEHHNIPTFLFINKMDLTGADRDAVMRDLQTRLNDGCIAFPDDVFSETNIPGNDDFLESVAMRDESLLNHYLDQATVPASAVTALIASRKLFPCFMGSALKMDGVNSFIAALQRFIHPPQYGEAFAAKVYKIGRDAQGNRLTYMKITGGTLKVKDILKSGPDEREPWEEKVDQIRIYSGLKFQAVDRIEAGAVCAVTGLTRTVVGQGLGEETASLPPQLTPVMTYQVLLNNSSDYQGAYLKLKQLEEEDPQLHITWNSIFKEIHIQPMGLVQLEILKRMILERFQLDVDFGSGNIVYRETIAAPVEGIGHFEPLRHYAEVHLLLEPAKRGSGLHFTTNCSTDHLDLNWQRLIMTHLLEKEHLGVLTGSPITDMRITVVAGRAHTKHTEGGDFRQATYRALRQGLRQASSILLEPWYQFRLEVPSAAVGRAMTDLQRMNGTFDPPETQGEFSILTGTAPVATMRDYMSEVTAYTRGEGRIFCTVDGYKPCHNQEEVIRARKYDPDADLDNPCDSVFCSHGAGVIVKWDQVREHAHVDSGLRWNTPVENEQERATSVRTISYSGTAKEDEELMKIFEKTYGQIQRKTMPPKMQPLKKIEEPHQLSMEKEAEYLLVDGYNIIFAWDELKSLASDNIEAARNALIEILSNYQGYQSCQVILVFDAYKVKQNPGSVVKHDNIYVVYTKEAETADAYIEKTTYELGKKHRVRVATSDRLEQMIILGHGAVRVSAREFHDDIERVNVKIASLIQKNNDTNRESGKLKYRATIIKE
ncbi:MAG: TetM/TetW/TetO/TetS family tetracycline resistance ribosomal protection protein [Firmicutes bacterium]|nr:TetM/TetW/TetO/TetS family tetracycline resistance ribosomal protection protein [Bacillota bacterium]